MPDVINLVNAADWNSALSPEANVLALQSGAYWVQNAARPYSLTSPAPDTLRFELRPGDVWTAVDPPSKERTEIAGETTFPQGMDVRVSYRWRVEPGPANHAKWLVAGQFHQTAGGGLSPPFEICLVGDRMSVVIDTSGNGEESYSNYVTIYRDERNIVRGRLYSLEIDATFDPVRGSVRVVRDGVTLADYRGPLGYAGMGAVYWKEGVYRAAAGASIAMTYADLSIAAGAPSAPPDRGPPEAQAPQPSGPSP